MQVCETYINKQSQDQKSRKLYEYMKSRDKPHKNGLGLDKLQKIWKLMEKIERNIYFDKIFFGKIKERKKTENRTK